MLDQWKVLCSRSEKQLCVSHITRQTDWEAGKLPPLGLDGFWNEGWHRLQQDPEQCLYSSKNLRRSCDMNIGYNLCSSNLDIIYSFVWFSRPTDTYLRRKESRWLTLCAMIPTLQRGFMWLCQTKWQGTKWENWDWELWRWLWKKKRMKTVAMTMTCYTEDKLRWWGTHHRWWTWVQLFTVFWGVEDYASKTWKASTGKQSDHQFWGFLMLRGWAPITSVQDQEEIVFLWCLKEESAIIRFLIFKVFSGSWEVEKKLLQTISLTKWMLNQMIYQYPWLSRVSSAWCIHVNL